MKTEVKTIMRRAGKKPTLLLETGKASMPPPMHVPAIKREALRSLEILKELEFCGITTSADRIIKVNLGGEYNGLEILIPITLSCFTEFNVIVMWCGL